MKIRNKIVAVLLGVSMISSQALPVMAEGEAVTAVENLTIAYQSNARGVETDENLRFSWNMNSNVIAQGQVSYQIIVADAISNQQIWDSGRVESSDSVGVSCKVEGLEKERKYSWTVTVETKDGQSITAEPVYFITDADMSSADWIMPVQESGSMPLLRTEKTVKGEVQAAYLYISALGTYTAYINGREVQVNDFDDVFNPGWTDYKYYTNYQTYEVTDYIEGENLALGIELGNGWYGGNIGEVGSYGNVIGEEEKNELAAIAKLVIQYADGSMETITTNEKDWKSSDKSPVLANDFFDGETYDANVAKEIKGWNEPGYDTSSWQTVTAGTYTGELKSGTKAVAGVAKNKTLTPVGAYTYKDAETISKKEAGNDFGAVVKHEADITAPVFLKAGDKLIVDMGQNAAGAVEFTVQGQKDTLVKLTHAEMLNDGRTNSEISEGGSDGPEGSLYMKAITNAEVTDRYILSDEESQTFCPSYTYHGYRYVQFEATEDVVLENIKGRIYTAAFDQTGFLSTNNEDINQLVSNTLWSQISNYVSIPTDCPQRGERAGWTGDAQLFAATGVYNFDVFAFLENYDEIMQTHAANNDNTYGAIMPASFVGFFAEALASGWSDAGIIIPWVLYQQTGDDTLITEYYGQMDAYMDKVVEKGYNPELFGDWLGTAPASTPYLNSVYQIYTTQLMEKMGGITGNQEAADKYNARYEELKSAFLEKYVDESGNVLSATADEAATSRHGYTVIDNSQTALLWALKCGLYINEEQRDNMIANLLVNIKNEGGAVREGAEENTLSVGFLGVNVILPVLTEIGAADVAYDLLLQDAMPSWLYSVKNGATTIWERWNSYSVDNSFGDSGMNSFNHYSYGACLEWMYQYMAGITTDEEKPGFKHIILQPTIDKNGAINQVDGTYNSLYGEIASEWITEEGKLKSYTVKIPANTTATLYLPIQEEEAASMEAVTGVSYVGMTDRNGILAAEFALEAGAYQFQVEDGGLHASLGQGYITAQ